VHKLTPAVLRRMVAAGHELANHTMTHPHNLSALSPAAKEAEIDRTYMYRLIRKHAL